MVPASGLTSVWYQPPGLTESGYASELSLVHLLFFVTRRRPFPIQVTDPPHGTDYAYPLGQTLRSEYNCLQNEPIICVNYDTQCDVYVPRGVRLTSRRTMRR